MTKLNVVIYNSYTCKVVQNTAINQLTICPTKPSFLSKKLLSWNKCSNKTFEN